MMEDKAFATIQKYHMLADGDNVIVALSGGADSMALLHFLHTWRQKLGIMVSAVHINHGLRGQEADRDEAFVRAFCAGLGIRLEVEALHMAGRQRPAAQSVEEWGRKLRYACFQRLAEQYGAKIATAHTQSDNTETVLFHMIRGAGPKGLSGIPPVRGAFVRPLLGVVRSEIEIYCKSNGLNWVTDSTNLEPHYARNRLRLEVLPALEEIHPGAGRAIARMAMDMGELNAYLVEQARALLEKAKDRDGYQVAPLLAAPQPVRLYALAGIGGASVKRGALADMERVAQGVAKGANLSKGRVVRLRKGCLCVDEAVPPKDKNGYIYLLRNGQFDILGRYHFRVWMLNSAEWKDFSQKNHAKHLTFAADYDKILKSGVVRSRKTGDLFAPPRRGVTKTLKKWMNETGIPPAERDILPLICDGSRVLWVWGAGFAAGLQPVEHSEMILLVEQLDGGAPDGPGAGSSE